VRPMEYAAFVIDSSQPAAYHATRALVLEKLLYTPSFDAVEFKLIGPGGLHPSVALAYLDLLDQNPPKHARIVSLSNLLGSGDMALWLGAARDREIRPSAIALVPQRPVIEDCRHCYAHRLDYAVRVNLLERENDICLARISEHVELDEILYRMLTRADLAELLLLRTPELDAALAGQPTAPASPASSTIPEGDEEFDAMFGPEDADGEAAL
jgi:hypothetical protein